LASAYAYLADYCQPTTVTAGSTRLRSANTQQLAIPRTNTGYGDALLFPDLLCGTACPLRCECLTVVSRPLGHS